MYLLSKHCLFRIISAKQIRKCKWRKICFFFQAMRNCIPKVIFRNWARALKRNQPNHRNACLPFYVLSVRSWISPFLLMIVITRPKINVFLPNLFLTEVCSPRKTEFCTQKEITMCCKKLHLAYFLIHFASCLNCFLTFSTINSLVLNTTVMKPA